MAAVKASMGTLPFFIEIKSPSGNLVIADEPVAKGGQDKGFSPKELLASALAACTSATVRMYVDHKAWNVQKINVEIELIEKEGQTTFNRKLSFEGDLDEKQRARLLSVANACPIHKILTNPIAINTELTH